LLSYLIEPGSDPKSFVGANLTRDQHSLSASPIHDAAIEVRSSGSCQKSTASPQPVQTEFHEATLARTREYCSSHKPELVAARRAKANLKRKAPGTASITTGQTKKGNLN
jgi:hypothetical protein